MHVAFLLNATKFGCIYTASIRPTDGATCKRSERGFPMEAKRYLEAKQGERGLFMNMFNVSYRKIGGLHFFRLGVFCFSFCVSRSRAKVEKQKAVTGLRFMATSMERG